jgi:hypothetical protein
MLPLRLTIEKDKLIVPAIRMKQLSASEIANE